MEREKNILKERTNLKDKIEYTSSEKSFVDRRKNTKEGKKARVSENSTESPEDLVASSSRTISSRKIVRHPEKSNLKEEGKKKPMNLAELSKRFIKEVGRRIGRVSTNSPMDKALEAMRRILKSPFAPCKMKEVKPKRFSPPVLDKFNEKFDPVSHLLHFKQIILLEEVTEGLTCKLFSMTFNG